MRLGELIAASSSATELAGTLAGLMTVTVAAGVELTPAGLTALIGAAKALEALKAVDPGQTLDPAALEGLMATAAAHAALMAVAQAQDVELTAATLASFIAAHKDNVLVDTVGVSFRARSLAKKLVQGTGPDDDPDVERVDTTENPLLTTFLNSPGYQPGPDDMGLPYYLKAAEIRDDTSITPTPPLPDGDAPTGAHAAILSGYNVMKYVDVDSSGDHMIDIVTTNPFAPAGMAAPALATAETGQAMWTGRIVNRVQVRWTDRECGHLLRHRCGDRGDVRGSVWWTRCRWNRQSSYIRRLHPQRMLTNPPELRA